VTRARRLAVSVVAVAVAGTVALAAASAHAQESERGEAHGSLRVFTQPVSPDWLVVITPAVTGKVRARKWLAFDVDWTADIVSGATPRTYGSPDVVSSATQFSEFRNVIGAGAAATVSGILYVITNYGYDKAFLWFGIGQGLVILVLSQVLKAPKPGEAPKAAPRLNQSARDFQPLEMIRTPVFWILYVMFVLVAASGLVVTAQVAPIARDYKIAGLPVNFLFISSTVLVMAGIVDNILNGLARPTFGWVSDHIGRENTMAIVFTCGAFAYWALGTIGASPWGFILSAGLVYFTWGEIYSLFPAICTDVYGPKYATTNAGLLYTSKGAASFLVPVAAWLQQSTGSWHAVFVAAAIANVVVGALALFVVKPMREAAIRGTTPSVRIAAATE